jgi:WD40 repeat protein
VTGAEDTTIRISAILDSPTTGPWGSVQTLRVLSTHDSGVQEASWSKCGKYLFTSAACEEFFVWRVRRIPSFGIATILAAVCPKDDPKSELRITSFDVVEVEEGEESGFLLCLTLSNSTIKVNVLFPRI